MRTRIICRNAPILSASPKLAAAVVQSPKAPSQPSPADAPAVQATSDLQSVSDSGSLAGPLLNTPTIAWRPCELPATFCQTALPAPRARPPTHRELALAAWVSPASAMDMGMDVGMGGTGVSEPELPCLASSDVDAEEDCDSYTRMDCTPWTLSCVENCAKNEDTSKSE